MKVNFAKKAVGGFNFEFARGISTQRVGAAAFTEVVKGLTRKAATGGTPNRAPIGYLNVHVRDENGRDIRTVQIDPERGPLICWAVQAYASGNWTISQLHHELIARGLTSLPTPKRPAKPMSLSSLHRMLGNPYYKGDVIYRGVKYAGSHEPLVPPEVWYQVQYVLTAHNTAGDRTQRHDHYLKGTLYCGSCGSRLLISNAKSRNGNISPADTTWPFGILLDPTAQAQAQTWADDPAAYAGTIQTRRPMQFVAGLNFDHQVPATGVEPVTLGLRVPCSTN